MPIPDFQTLMRPLLDAHSSGREWVNKELIELLASEFEVTEGERLELLPSGRARLFDNRVGWAKTHMRQAGLLNSPRRSISIITDRGREVLKNFPNRVDMKVLEQFEEFREFRNRGRKIVEQTDDGCPSTPEENLEEAYSTLRAQLEIELLARVKENSPAFLEFVVVERGSSRIGLDIPSSKKMGRNRRAS